MKMVNSVLMKNINQQNRNYVPVALVLQAKMQKYHQEVYTGTSEPHCRRQMVQLKSRDHSALYR